MKVISIADLHLRDTVPSCTDATPSEWMQIQREAIDKLYHYAVDNKVDALLVGGDIFHSENTASFECINLFQSLVKALKNCGIETYVMAGNHDLPGHSSSNIYKSAIGVIFNSDGVKDMSECKFCSGANFDKDVDDQAKVIFKHVLTIPKDKIPPFMECETPETLLSKYQNAKIIFTGDYHKSFSYEHKGRLVLNSGCLTKQASDFEDYETGCWLVEWAETYDTVIVTDYNWCKIDIPQTFYRNAEVKKELDKDIEAFANGIKKQSVTLDYIESVKKELPNHEKPIQDKVETWINNINQ